MDRIYTLPEGWSYKELKEIADVITGVSFKPDDITKDGIRILRSGNIQNGYVQTKIDDVFLNDSYFNKQNTIQYLDNCITSSTGSVDVLGKCGTVFDVFEKTQIGAFVRLVRSKDIDNALYISLILHSPLYFQYIRQFAKNGTSINNIKNEHLEDFKFPFPPKDLKERISRFYLSLEKKILLNTYMIAELEAMAKQLYDYWFVQFDFPDENGKPYKSSGGKMVYDEKLKREIPEGWEVKNLFYIANYKNGLACQNYRPKEDENSLPVIKINEMHNGFTPETERASANIPSEVIIENGDVLFAWSASLEVMLWGLGRGALNQHIFKVTSNNGFPKSFFYYQLLEYVDYFRRIAEAKKTTMGHITKDHLEQSQIAVPPTTDLPNQLEEILSPIMDKIISLSSERIYLTHLRDSLLPMLMNGQITVE